MPQYWIEDGTGRLARADLAFPEQKVAVEYDGSWRDGELWALNRDRDRLNRGRRLGDRICDRSIAQRPRPHGPHRPRRYHRRS
ncbi:MAG: hypothetical protein WCC65_05820 [Pseudonocardiaceae bacterium]